MEKSVFPVAVIATEAPASRSYAAYPEAFAERMAGRQNRPLGELFGLSTFNVKLTQLAPGAISNLRHWHSAQDEFVYVLSGFPVLITNAGETPLAPGMCTGFKAGNANAHQLVNRSKEIVLYLEIGHLSANDSLCYPDDDLEEAQGPNGEPNFVHKDGTPY